METTDRLPKGEFVIGAREIGRDVEKGRIKKVFVASNCPQGIVKKFFSAEIIRFSGDQRELAARLGKPFPVAAAGLLRED